MVEHKWLVIWLVILSAVLLLVIIYLIYIPNIHIYIPNEGNYTFDVGDNLMKIYDLQYNKSFA